MQHSIRDGTLAPWARALLAALLLGAPATQAALPTGTLDYTQRLGIVGPSDPIEVWLRFTLAPASTPLHFSSDPLTGFAAGDLPATGQRLDPATGLFVDVPFASIHRAMLDTWYLCNTSFFVGCGGAGEYSWVWGGDQPGHPSPSGHTEFDLAPGDSIEYLLGTLVPKAGGASPGGYLFFQTGLQIDFTGLDASGAELLGYHGLAVTCPTLTADCAFTRVVQAQTVPEPAVPALLAMALGVGLLQAWAATGRRPRHDQRS